MHSKSMGNRQQYAVTVLRTSVPSAKLIRNHVHPTHLPHIFPKPRTDQLER